MSSQSSTAFTTPNPSEPDSLPDSSLTQAASHPPLVHTNELTPGSSNLTLKLELELEEQSKRLAEQDTLIKTLNAQLAQCKADLQAQVDLAKILGSALTDTERHLGQAHVKFAKERETLNTEIEQLRNGSTSKGGSAVEEKEVLEQRLDEERKAKERARHLLELRMKEVHRKKSKFACL